MNPKELEQVLALHARWVKDEEGGVRADLSCAKLMYAYLHGAKLMYAYLMGTDLRYSDLRDAYLHGANFFRAKLQGADFRGTIWEMPKDEV
jgi:uncharacterized protein YjbI with pentapeptide repeats